MKSTQIFRIEHEVNNRLLNLNIEKSGLVQVMHKVVAARNGSVSIDPTNAPGLLAYIYGTRALREMLLPQGWKINRDNNVESTFNPQSNIKLIYQNADCACEESREPRPISEKGKATSKIVQEGQLCLFPELEQYSQVNSMVWFFCVYIKGDDVRAELSCPMAIEDGQFKGFHERIFIIKTGEWDGNNFGIDNKDNTDEQNKDDFEINISRKTG